MAQVASSSSSRSAVGVACIVPTAKAVTNNSSCLVRFNNVTHVWNNHHHHHPNNDSETLPSATRILEWLSKKTGWPVHHLECTHIHYPYVSVRVISSVRGGKGGFGTLLKAASKQNGARATTDFGACRDLQGRRLRHVNDEIKLRKWRDLKRQEQNGTLTVESEMEQSKTQSGIVNWHLMVPHWATDSLSNKATNRMQRQHGRQLQQWNTEAETIQQRKVDKEQIYQQSVFDYVQQTTDASLDTHDKIKDAIQQGLVQKKKEPHKKTGTVGARLAKRKRDSDNGTDSDNESSKPQSLCALSGHAIVNDNDNDTSNDTSNDNKKKKKKEDNDNSGSGPTNIQSTSDFCTVALLLDRTLSTLLLQTTANSTSNSSNSRYPSSILYYEVRVVTGGLAQIGWAAMFEPEFVPNNDSGDGVGDDVASFAYDGSRGLKFHNGAQEAFGTNTKNGTYWEAGDVIGCSYHITTGRISFSCNGTDLGVAFTTTPKRNLVPAMSCNKGEILQVHTQPHHMKYLPTTDTHTSVILVGTLLLVGGLESSEEEERTPSSANQETTLEEERTPSSANQETFPSQLPSATTATTTHVSSVAEPPQLLEPFQLEDYSSVEELEKLGMNQLKGASIAMGVKCGGSSQERAKRLFLLKGLHRSEYPMKVRGKNFVL